MKRTFGDLMTDKTKRLVNGGSQLRLAAGLSKRRRDNQPEDAQTNQSDREPHDLPESRIPIRRYIAVQIRNEESKILNLKSYHRIGTAFDVNAVNETNVFRFAG